ncbi:TetR/AcrR family transcriptional regulator [Streptomyces hoynatensis]|uniref:TetR family transcriptional regulator n=1 Tax=Streptomyces hoynatensis TaxID=1141874 RepID=A0A3A9Z1G8_9ACTN|nr:TetR family transcriptional regulator [Streptomyces hoynatensis]RKN42292.1 TetR family transcriptional regulator [Streptomyces hoynatensis]
MTSTSTRRGATRQRLYEAAITLIAEQGFSATTMEQIAERAGVAKGTVYYNFGGKTELFQELLRQGVAPLTAGLRAAAQGALAGSGGAVDALDGMTRAALVFIAANPDFTRLLVAEQWRTNRAWHPTLTEVRHQLTGLVEEVLQQGVKSGELDPALDIELTGGALVGMVALGALEWLAFHPARSLDEVHAALSVLLRGRLGGGGAA